MKPDFQRTFLLSAAFTIAALVSNPVDAHARHRNNGPGVLGSVKTFFTKLGTKGNAKTTHYKMHSRKKQAHGVGAGFKWRKKSICAAYGNP